MTGGSGIDHKGMGSIFEADRLGNLFILPRRFLFSINSMQGGNILGKRLERFYPWQVDERN